MLLADILRHKGTGVLSIDPEATLADAVQVLVRYNVGSLLVCDQSAPDCGPLAGILTERDILRACATGDGSLSRIKVRDAMSTPVQTAAPSDEVVAAMGLLTQRRIRHLPVLEGTELVGMISIGDLVKAQHDELSFENEYLKSYIQS